MTIWNRRIILCGVIGILILSAIPAAAQVTATLLGTARDSSGAVLPRVKITATNLENNLAHETYTSNTGDYRIIALSVGRYRVEAEATGFQKFLPTRSS